MSEETGHYQGASDTEPQDAGGRGDDIRMKQLLEAGAHFGHQKSYWNPKMKPHIFDVRGGVHIINLQKTVELFKTAYRFVSNLTSKGGVVLFVGTKQQASGIIKEEGERCGMPYVNIRWLGGTLTNFGTIRSRLQYLESLQKDEEENRMEMLPYKEAVKLRKEAAKLTGLIGGLASMKRLPDAIFIVDTHKESNAFKEARKLGIPVIGLVDTNCDPTGVDYIIPTNDDAMRAIKLFTSRIADACVEGTAAYAETVKDLPEDEVREKAGEDEGPIVEKRVHVFRKFGGEEEETDEEPETVARGGERRAPEKKTDATVEAVKKPETVETEKTDGERKTVEEPETVVAENTDGERKTVREPETVATEKTGIERETVKKPETVAAVERENPATEKEGEN